MKRFWQALCALSTVGVVGTVGAGCATYDAPPEVTIDGLAQGQLADPKAPIVLSFSKPPVQSTVRVKIAPYGIDDRDDEGNLADEVTPKGQLDVLFAHDPGGDIGGTSMFESVVDKDTMVTTVKLRVVPDKKPPTGAPLVLLVEPGLADETGAKTVDRRRLVFTYTSPLMCTMPVTVVRSGTYFLLATITEPIPVQVRLFAVIEVDAATGNFKSQFTKAKRNPDPNRCPTPCAMDQVCRLVPAPACVAPSEPAGSVDEFSDYVPDPEPPVGFGFAADGCSADQDAKTASFSTLPADVIVKSPPVTLQAATLTASFTLASDDTLRGTGSLVAEDVLIGILSSGKGQGDLTARSIPDDQVPPGVPGP